MSLPPLLPSPHGAVYALLRCTAAEVAAAALLTAWRLTDHDDAGAQCLPALARGCGSTTEHLVGAANELSRYFEVRARPPIPQASRAALAAPLCVARSASAQRERARAYGSHPRAADANAPPPKRCVAARQAALPEAARSCRAPHPVASTDPPSPKEARAASPDCVLAPSF